MTAPALRSILFALALPALLLLSGCSLFGRSYQIDAIVEPTTYTEHDDIKWKVLARSVENRPIYYTTFGKGDDITIIWGCFHGNERCSPMLPLHLADLLHKQPALIRPDKKVVLVPFQNPDGYVAGTRRNANNVDLNRNYPTGNWGKQPKRGRVYFGEAPASEPESKAVLKLMKKLPPNKIISIHQPLHCNNNDGPNGMIIAELLAKYNKYEIKADIGFPTPGSFGTYAGKELGIPMVTLELPRGIPYSEEHKKMWEDNREALLAVINFDVPENPAEAAAGYEPPAATSGPASTQPASKPSDWLDPIEPVTRDEN
jgi:protein MpaA